MVGTCDRPPRSSGWRSPRRPRRLRDGPRTCRRPRRQSPRAESTVTVPLHGRPLVLHLAAPAMPAATPPAALVLYASGDGGWFGTGVQMFHVLAAAGSRRSG